MQSRRVVSLTTFAPSSPTDDTRPRIPLDARGRSGRVSWTELSPSGRVCSLRGSSLRRPLFLFACALFCVGGYSLFVCVCYSCVWLSCFFFYLFVLFFFTHVCWCRLCVSLFLFVCAVCCPLFVPLFYPPSVTPVCFSLLVTLRIKAFEGGISHLENVSNSFIAEGRGGGKWVEGDRGEGRRGRRWKMGVEGSLYFF